MQQQTTQPPLVGSVYEEQQQQDGSLQLVMSEEQIETLRRQISVYSTICRQLMEMHKASLATPPAPPFPAAGGTMAHMPYDPMHKATSRQRWSPTQVQLQILERIFEQGRVTPNKQRIKEITNELSRHGPIAETNVYNWFQNRKARAKRKQASVTSSQANNNTSSRELESEADTDGGDSPPVEKRSKKGQHISHPPAQQQHNSSPALDQENRVPHLSVAHEKLGSVGGDRPPRERSLNSLFREDQPVFAKANDRPWNADVYQARAPHLQRTNKSGRGMSNGAPAHCLVYLTGWPADVLTQFVQV